jgi:xanthine dehydrogenase accessory factor
MDYNRLEKSTVEVGILDAKLLGLVSREVSEGRMGVLCTVVEEVGSSPRSRGASMWVRPDGSIAGTVGGGLLEHQVIQRALEMLKTGEGCATFKKNLNAPDGMVCGGEVTVYLEVLGNEERLVIFGAGHVGKAIGDLAHFLGFSVVVWDEREEFANPERFPYGEVHPVSLGEFMSRFSGGSRTYVVICTRGHALDGEVVRLTDGLEAAYIGLIGSRSKLGVLKANLLKEGVSEAHFDRIFKPIGLPIKAETPEEIALSVMAEIVAVKRGADVGALRAPW